MPSVLEFLAHPAKKAVAEASKSAKAVQITRVPAKPRSEKKPRIPKKAALGNALSSRAEVVAVNKSESSV
jgi:hypothetical protein